MAGRSSCANPERWHREVEAHDRVDGKHERRCEAREQQIRRLIAMPVTRRAAPTQREHAVDDLLRLADRVIAQRREVGNQTNKPEQQRNRAVRRNREDVPYQRAAECGHSVVVLGYGNSKYAIHGRPVWISGNKPAQATANSVIASAKRLIDVRHFWFNKNKIAEISVPAWPIPIHQTKLTIAKPQPTGMLIAQMPTPLMISQATATFRTSHRKCQAESRKPAERYRARQDDRRDLVCDCGVAVPRLEHPRQPADVRAS